MIAAEGDLGSAPKTVEATRLLTTILDGGESERKARDRLFESVYEELRRLAGALMRRERADHTLRPTAVVHEAYLKLIRQDAVNWKSRAHFFGIAAHAIRQVLVDHARERAALKRGGALTRVTFDEGLAGSASRAHEMIDLDAAMVRLSDQDERAGRVTELKIFGGLEMTEIAFLLKVSKRTVEGDWTFARMWLARELNPNPAPPSASSEGL